MVLRDSRVASGEITPSLQDGAAHQVTFTPGFTRGYFHPHPPGAAGGSSSLWELAEWAS